MTLCIITLSRYLSNTSFPISLSRYPWEREAIQCKATDMATFLSKECGKITIHFLWGEKDTEQDMIIIGEEPADIASVAMDSSKLTRRETEILVWLSQGKTNSEIGLALSISPRTVKKHLEHIYSKLRVHRRSGAVARSISL